MGIHIVGGARTVVEAGGLKIDELAGNVATRQDTISIAHVTIAEPCAEPWLTLDYDEWICVMRGRMVLEFEDGKSVEVRMLAKCLRLTTSRPRADIPCTRAGEGWPDGDGRAGHAIQADLSGVRDGVHPSLPPRVSPRSVPARGYK